MVHTYLCVKMPPITKLCIFYILSRHTITLKTFYSLHAELPHFLLHLELTFYSKLIFNYFSDFYCSLQLAYAIINFIVANTHS